MKVLIIGGGGREHALAWKISQSQKLTKLYCAPGNAGISSCAECIPISADNINALKDFAIKNRIDLTVVGPELPLTLGISDLFISSGLRIFGPTRSGAQLEGSKIFAKKLMQDAGIPTADFSVFTHPDSAKKHIQQKKTPCVVKADGLAAGKGVFPCRTPEEACAAVDFIMVKREFGDAGGAIVIEDFLDGEEASFICFTDGKTVIPLPSSQDHKRIFDDDRGPNTGGMGAYSPAPVITSDLEKKVMNTVMYPLIKALADRSIQYKGIVYAGLMIADGAPRVLEFNVRFGDPETQPILFRLDSDLLDLMNAVIDEKLGMCTIICDQRPSVCVVMASAGYPDNYTKGHIINGLADAARIPDTFVFHAGTALKNNSIVTSGGRVLGVTSRGATIQSAIQTAYTAVDKITWQGAHFRRDIARKALTR